MKSYDYWQERLLDIWLYNDQVDQEYIKQMQKRMRAFSLSLEEQIEEFIQRWASTEGLDVNEVRATIGKQEQLSWKMTLSEFRRKAIEGGYESELNEEYFRSRISRLEQLQAQLYMDSVEAAVIERSKLEQHLTNQFNTNFQRTIYELTDRGSFSLSVNYAKYNKSYLKKVLTMNWLGSNFSKRIWKNLTVRLPQLLKSSLSQSVVNGWGIDKTVNDLKTNIKNVADYRMNTLVQTESSHVVHQATLDSYKETNVDQWQWYATLETHTCKICRDLDLKIFSVNDNQKQPPIHPNCRCTMGAYIEGWVHLKRWSRDPVTGKGKRVEFMSFDEWRKKEGLAA